MEASHLPDHSIHQHPQQGTNRQAQVPFRIPLVKPDLPDFADIAAPLQALLQSGRLSNFGMMMQRLEDLVTDFLAVPVVAVSSGTQGLLFALSALDLPPGSRVLVPSFTFSATVQAICWAGHRPLFAEIGADLTISPDDVAALLETHADIAAVLPVHVHGLPCRVDALQQIVTAAAQRSGHSIALLYDAAHAFGARYADRPVGHFGQAEVFSLSATKMFTTVEGGLIASHNQDFLNRIRAMRNYGISTAYNARYPGLNGKMSEVHALIGVTNLPYLEQHLAERRQKAAYYISMLQQQTSFLPQLTSPCTVHVYKDMTVLAPVSLTHRRDQLRALLHASGIETRTYFAPPVHQQQQFCGYAERRLPATEDAAARVITLPFHRQMTYADIDAIVTTLAEAEQTLAG